MLADGLRQVVPRRFQLVGRQRAFVFRVRGRERVRVQPFGEVGQCVLAGGQRPIAALERVDLRVRGRHGHRKPGKARGDHARVDTLLPQPRRSRARVGCVGIRAAHGQKRAVGFIEIPRRAAVGVAGRAQPRVGHRRVRAGVDQMAFAA